MFVEFPDLELDTKHGFLNSTVNSMAPSDYANISSGHGFHGDDADDDNANDDDVVEDRHHHHNHHMHQRLAGADALSKTNAHHQRQPNHQADGLAASASVEQSPAEDATTIDTAAPLCTITDYSPEWSFTDGGVKVLITGPWECTQPAPSTHHHSPNYTVLFDTFPVPTQLVQAGVLRCFCPAHEVGLATVQVARDGFVVSDSVVFEYKSAYGGPLGAVGDAATTVVGCSAAAMPANESLFRFSLYSRLEAVDERLQIKAEPRDASASGGGGGSRGSRESSAAAGSGSSSEERLVGYCQQLSQKQWRAMTPGTWVVSGTRGMTLLHLAAALGYAKLVCVLLAWRAENPNTILETEIDALSQDQHGYTPLMWSLARGHAGCARILYRWNGTAMNVRNRAQQTALDVCTAAGHAVLAGEFGRLDTERRERNALVGTTGFPTTAHDGSRSAYAAEDPFRRQLTHSNPMFGSISYGSGGTGTGGGGCEAGVHGGGDVVTAASLGGGGGGDMLLQSNGVGMLLLDADCGSPMSMGSMGSMHSSRSHDGVFLRPGAVSR